MTALAWAFLGVPAQILLPLGLGLLSAAVLLYILRLRRRPVVVPFVSLWERELGQKTASRLRSRLRRLLSLLLQLSLLGLLLLALSDPRPDSYAEPEKSIAILIDTSASMSAQGDDGRSRLEQGLKKLRAKLVERGPKDEVLLIEMSGKPAHLGPWTRSSEELERSLLGLSPTDEVAALPAALQIAREALVGRKDRRIVILSDGALPPVSGEAVGAEDLGQTPIEFLSAHDEKTAPLENVAISALAARRYPLDPDRFEVLLEVANTGATEAEVEVLFFRPGPEMNPRELIEARRIDVPAKDRSVLVLADLSSIREGIICRVERVDGGGNWLTADDTAYALLNRREMQDVLVVGEENNFLDAALLTNPGVRFSRINAADFPPKEPPDLLVFDGTSPPQAQVSAPALYLGPPSPEQASEAPVAFGKELRLFGFDSWDKKSRVFRFIDPYDIQVLEGRELKPKSGDQVLGKSGGSPILVSGTRNEEPFLALGFDPRKSDFVLRAAFPLFIENALQLLAPAQAQDLGQSLQVGETSRQKARSSSDLILFEGPLGHPRAQAWKLPVASGEVQIRPTRAGFYRITDDEGARLVAANAFHEGEASLAPAKSLALDDTSLAATETETEPTPRRTSKTLAEKVAPRLEGAVEPWMLILLLVCAISAIEWWSYHRRITV